MAFGVPIETLAERFELKRIPSDERGFEGVNDVSNPLIISTVRCFADTDGAIISVNLDEEPIAAVVYRNDFGLYVCNFECLHVCIRIVWRGETMGLATQILRCGCPFYALCEEFLHASPFKGAWSVT